MIGAKTVRRLAVAMAVGAISVSAGSSTAAAQPSAHAFEISGEFATLRLSESDTWSAGIGANARWTLVRGLALDGSVTYFPEDRQNLVLALGGLRPTVTFGKAEVSGRARVGVLDFQKVNEPFACLAIFPAPLECQLAAGYTALAIDFGGGVDVGIAREGRLRVHAEVGDLLVRYNLNAFRSDGSVTNGFTSQNFLFNVGLGWRF